MTDMNLKVFRYIIQGLLSCHFLDMILTVTGLKQKHMKH